MLDLSAVSSTRYKERGSEPPSVLSLKLIRLKNYSKRDQLLKSRQTAELLISVNTLFIDNSKRVQTLNRLKFNSLYEEILPKTVYRTKF